MEKEIIYDKTSEEYKAIKLLEIKATNYSDDGLILHYNIILYNLIINLMKENKKQKEINKKAVEYIENETYYSAPSGKVSLNLQNDSYYKLLQILEDKEV